MLDDDGLRVTSSVVIPAHELVWSFGPSSGPGGQHANRAHTRAEIRFDIEHSSALSEHQRRRVMARLGPMLVVSADDERSQLRNRRLALDRVRLKMANALRVETVRRATRPTRGSVERRLEAKRRQSARKRDRRQGGTDHS